MAFQRKLVELLVESSVESFAEGFKGRHVGEVDNPEGTINIKIHNIFISILGQEVKYYAALVRSLDSSLGNMLESLAFKIAELNYEVRKEVVGPLSNAQTSHIAELLEKYKRRELRPSIEDYKTLRQLNYPGSSFVKRHDSDYYLIDRESGVHHLIELKIGGDLDNKKARSEKEAILEQYAILSNVLDESTDILIHFATAYNRYGEDCVWRQERVKQFFADEELLIGRDFWNFICKSEIGYDSVISSYKKASAKIISAL